jgi:CRISPR/Cas system-associated exonuclease Cas4 (RecB family)
MKRKEMMIFLNNYDWIYDFNPSLVNEFIYCKRSFWLHFNNLKLVEENEDLKIGKIEHVFNNLPRK